MEGNEYDRFTARLRERLAADARVLGLVALGSMSGEAPAADAFSDHDFFVLCRAGEQEGLRSDLSWLPDADQLVLSFRETAHGVKALYRSAHLLEFAVFDLEELWVARVNRYRTLLDRADVERRMQGIRQRTAAQVTAPDARWTVGQFMTALLVGAGRWQRGEKLAGRARLAEAAGHLARLFPAGPGGDSLDPLRRFEQRFPRVGQELEVALALDPPRAAARLLQLALREIPDFPAPAAHALLTYLGDTC